MKNILLMMAILVSIGSRAAVNRDEVSPQVIKAFQAKFGAAKEVTWSVNETYYKVTFSLYDNWLMAYYSKEGKLVNVIRHIAAKQLPMFLINSFQARYPHYWLSELFELSTEDGVTYFMTLENAEKKIIIKSAYGSDWTLYQTQKKEK